MAETVQVHDARSLDYLQINVDDIIDTSKMDRLPGEDDRELVVLRDGEHVETLVGGYCAWMKAYYFKRYQYQGSIDSGKLLETVFPWDKEFDGIVIKMADGGI